MCMYLFHLYLFPYPIFLLYQWIIPRSFNQMLYYMQYNNYIIFVIQKLLYRMIKKSARFQSLDRLLLFININKNWTEELTDFVLSLLPRQNDEEKRYHPINCLVVSLTITPKRREPQHFTNPPPFKNNKRTKQWKINLNTYTRTAAIARTKTFPCRGKPTSCDNYGRQRWLVERYCTPRNKVISAPY